jgi:hypothetical protein
MLRRWKILLFFIGGEDGVPSDAILAEDGTPILDEDGGYIVQE